MLKKFFSSTMAVVLVVGLLPTVALADESSYVEDDTENATAVENYVGNMGVETQGETQRIHLYLLHLLPLIILPAAH